MFVLPAVGTEAPRVGAKEARLTIQACSPARNLLLRRLIENVARCNMYSPSFP